MIVTIPERSDEMKNCIITGGNSGIGFQAAKQIAEKGYHVTLICRNEERASNAAATISKETGNNQVDYILSDLSIMSDVRKAAAEYLSQNRELHVLINNAADFDLSVKHPIITDDGFEKQFATNVAAPYLLSNLMLEALRNSGNGRIINISSQGLCVFPFIKLDLDNLDGSKHYSPSSTYYQNKLALLMLSLFMRKQYKDIRIQAIRVTNVKIDMSRYDNLPDIMKRAYSVKSKFSISPEEMARVYTMLATEDGYEGFLYDEKGSEVKANKSAYDKNTQKTLIEILVQKTGI